MINVLVDAELNIENITEIATSHNQNKYNFVLSEQAKTKIIKAQQCVTALALSEKPFYGINTGFGNFRDTIIALKDINKLQNNLVRSHACGVDYPISEDLFRITALVHAHQLSLGYSGVRVCVIEALLNLLNKRIYPFVPSKGSVGCSGDLAQLAHIALVLIGEGELIVNKERILTGNYRDDSGLPLQKISLWPKEGLSLINGLSYSLALAIMAYSEATKLIKHSLIASAVSVESLLGSLSPFNQIFADLNPINGHAKASSAIRRMCEKSAIIESHKNCNRVQDSYSLRCIPQVVGAGVLTSLYNINETIHAMFSSVTDNPIVDYKTGAIYSGGNFHGEPISHAMDNLAIAMASLGNMTERRIAKTLDAQHNNGLPECLVASGNEGLESGLMILQYSTASLVAENKILAHPASVDSIPTGNNQEDYVSFSPLCGQKVLSIINNLKKIVAIEFLCASQALELRKLQLSASVSSVSSGRAGIGTEIAFAIMREHVEFVTDDRPLYREIEIVLALMERGTIITEVEGKIGVI